MASIFGLPAPAFVANPCVAVNGYDGTCGVGVATQGLDALALSPGGGTGLRACPRQQRGGRVRARLDGTLTQSSCLMVGPPPGLCTASRLLKSPSHLAISPDGKNVYVADSSENRGRIDVLSRNPSSGALSGVGCVEERPVPEKHEAGEEEGEEEAKHEAPPPPNGCSEVPGLKSVESIAVTGDGSMVYAIGGESAVVFSRDPSSGGADRGVVRGQRSQQLRELPVAGRASAGRP